jgi:phosphatidylserine/phosphatidylglycerophosphate/cardiolipin synthase-like enzyme
MDLDDWFLRPRERGNPDTKIDSGHPDDVAWTVGNEVEALVHGAKYFAHLMALISELGGGDEVRFTDWRGDGDESMEEGHTDLSTLLEGLCQRGADVRGLLWRSHSERMSFSKKENLTLAQRVNGAGGEVLLDERVRRGGSHHQKLVVIRSRDSRHRDVAFVGGIDLSHGRRDDELHRGDPQAVKLDHRYGPRPPWHDIQLKIWGPAVADLDFTFRERWEDPTPLNHASRPRAWWSRAASRDRVPCPLPPVLPSPARVGHLAVQVLRTYPQREVPSPFASQGERSIARGFSKAVARARSLIYIEDQYLWSTEIAQILARALRRQRELQLIAVVPRYPDQDSRFAGPPARRAQTRAIALLQAAGGDRVGIYNLENDSATPIYVHAKVCIIDDVWALVGSANLNRRSWTHDSEVSCAIIDDQLDDRAPLDPAGLGDGSRRFARDLRIQLWAEHLKRSPSDPSLVDIRSGAEFWRSSALDLMRWKVEDGGAKDPPSRARPHEVEPVLQRDRGWAELAYRVVFDPDGRPRGLRKRHVF